MSTFDERAREWDTPERRERAEAVADAIRANVSLTPTTRTIGDLVLAEPSEGMRGVIGEKLAASGRPDVTAIPFDLTGGPPPGEPFDLAISLLVLHHVADTATALAAIRGLLVPGGRIAIADLDTEDGTFHDPDAEGIHHLGFDRAALGELARDAGFVDIGFRTATEIVEDDRRYPVFLLLGRVP
jgi:SAM-dependent methyltransferase